MHIEIELDGHVTLRAGECAMRLGTDGTITIAAHDHSGKTAEIAMGRDGFRVSDGSVSVLVPKG